MANTKVTGDLIASGTITAANLVSGTLDTLLDGYLTTNTYATQSYVTTAVNDLIAAAPASLDTLNELAAALNDDANFATTVTNSLATKLNLSGGTLTGDLEIYGTDASSIVHYFNNSKGGLIALSNYRLAISTSAINDDIVFGYSATDPTTSGNFVERVRIDNGTGDIITSNKISFTGTPASGSPYTFIQHSYNGGGNCGVRLIAHNPNNGVDSDLEFQVMDTSANYVTPLYLDGSTSRVGIGTNTPSHKLHVDGDIRQSKVVIRDDSIERYDSQADNAAVNFNYFGYNTTAAYFRDVNIWNGKNGLISQFDGSTNSLYVPNGSVGIGASSTSYKFEVTEDGNTFTVNPQSGGIDLHSTDNFAPHYQSTFDWYTGAMGAGSFKMRLDSDGNLGIGTTDPGMPLHVKGSNPGGYNGYGNNVIVVDDSNGNYSGIMFRGTGGSNAAIRSEGENALTFWTSINRASSWAERMRIDSSGRVLIGKTSSSYSTEGVEIRSDEVLITNNQGTPLSLNRTGNDGTLLSFAQDTSSIANINVSGNNLVFDMTARGRFEISNDEVGTGSGGATLRLTRSDTTVVAEDPVGKIEFYNTDADGAHVSSFIKGVARETYGRKGALTFGVATTTSTNAVEAMRINEAGNVGIGVTSPGAKLDVSGVINCTSSLTTGGSITVSGTGYREIKVDQTDSAAIRMGVSSGSAEGFILVENTGDNHYSQTPAVKILSNSGTVSEYARFTSSGLTFNGDTAAANALDDYEEGTFTPVVNSGTASANWAKYTKIGDLVFIVCELTLSGTRTASVFEVSGLPFTNGAQWTPCSFYAQYYNDEGVQQASGVFRASTNIFRVHEFGAESLGTKFGNGYFAFAGTYKVS